ncbi:flavohemoglobin expression-modulating QEGLA motif protein [Tessaracoccus massiliensis]|uniref:flavohemoglobin expression-modulating QEGLA motif protein n=1 Tax=Tessaracoccus massiliensis TaxID=1522311 RepID=UPI000590961E|nr:tyrosine/phenylalanine carboxypeptidase domain-containing protein [Tessaracoccus massiliensis]
MSPNPLAMVDQAIDLQLSQLSTSFRFILDITPIDADDVKDAFLAGDVDEPEFTYRDYIIEPEVLLTVLHSIDVSRVQDTTVAALLRNKHRELDLQLSMLRCRGSEDFRNLSIELFGSVHQELLTAAESILARVEPQAWTGDRLSAEEFLGLANEELNYYRSLEPQVDIHAEIRPDSTGVMVSDNVLIIGPEAGVSADRANALIQHEVGTHLVTQVNGSHQPLQVMGTGLAGYDETQEGLAVLAELACGELTASRLRQLAGRVITVSRMLGGASFRECWEGLVEAGFRPGGAFSTVMRIFRSGGLTKDACYLRGLLDLLGHLRSGGELGAFFLGKFALQDLPLIEELNARGVLSEPVVLPRWFDDDTGRERLVAASKSTDPTELIQGVAA